MKFFKIFLSVLVVLILVGVIGIFIFLKTFDINKFKPQIIAEIHKAIGRDASIGQMSLDLSWSQGATLNINQITIMDDQKFDYGHFLDIQSVDMNLDLWQLLTKKQMKITRIDCVEPVVNLIRLKDGTMNIPVPPPSDKPADLSHLTINRIQIQGGRIGFTDRSVEPPLFVPINNLNVKITSFAFERPVGLHADWGMYSKDNNIRIDGFLKADQAFQNIRLQDFQMNVGLSAVSLEYLKKSAGFVPFIQHLNRLSGDVSLALPDFAVGPLGLRTVTAQAELKNFFLETPDVPVPLRDVNGQLVLTGQDLELKGWTMSLASGRINFNGRVNDYWITRSFSSDMKAEGLSVAELMTLIPGMALPEGIGLDGKMKADLSVTGSALSPDPDAIIHSIRGSGSMAVDSGVVKGFNLMQALMTRLDKLSQILGIGIKDKILAELPEEYQKKLDIKGTPIRQLQIAFDMREAQINFHDVTLGLDEGSFTASGRLDIDQTLSLTPQVFVSPELTKVFVNSVEDLEVLVGDDGRLSVPLLPYEGPVVKLNVLPDTNYLVKKLAATRVRKELKGVVTDTLGLPGDFVDAVLQGGKSSQSDAAAQVDSSQKKTIKSKQDSTPGQVIGGVLDKILGQ